MKTYRKQSPITEYTLQQKLKEMGLERRRGEHANEHARRCMQYLKDKGWAGMLPEAARRQLSEDEIEAAKERIAIQEESKIER